ncbi:MAG: hypothetical protein KA109_02195 [Saprospiraceae bacterium]|jgi:fumarate reductase subunit D|nr:hypothetical protein [Saprospiraceae bacterium]MBK7607167.1 hypothetical protein [Saprospiraceae bacterium]MBP7800411.1 hypothetical protein [Saprospiraceae bacterium]MBP8093698.1 hypothetical protein [Saprospiraceae bacterium]
MNNLLLKIFQHDKWLHGFISGLFVPIVIFAALLQLLESLGILTTIESGQTVHILRPRTIALIVLFANIILMNVFKKMRWNQSMRGLAVSTFICIGLWVFKYGRDLF